MKMKKRAVLLSFVGATVLSLGLQSQQTFARTYVNQGYKSHAYRMSQRKVREDFNAKYYSKWCEDLTPGPAPEAKPEATPAPLPETKPAPKPDVTPSPAPEAKPEVDSSINNFETRVVELTNAERAKQGLAALKMDNELSKVAKLKSQDIQAKGYFAHNSPTYGTPFEMMKQFGISYRSAGENIAKGQRSPEQVVTAWMNSEGHRKNILGNFTHIGVGYIESGNVWTQMFISK